MSVAGALREAGRRPAAVNTLAALPHTGYTKAFSDWQRGPLMPDGFMVAAQEQCPTCGGIGTWERKARVRPCEEGLCVYLSSKDHVTLDELAQWIVDIGGRPMTWAYGYLVAAAAKGLLWVSGEADGLEMGERSVHLTELGRHVASDIVR
jgi:hypothetical protein